MGFVRKSDSGLIAQGEDWGAGKDRCDEEAYAGIGTGADRVAALRAGWGLLYNSDWSLCFQVVILSTSSLSQMTVRAMPLL